MSRILFLNPMCLCYAYVILSYVYETRSLHCHF